MIYGFFDPACRGLQFIWYRSFPSLRPQDQQHHRQGYPYGARLTSLLVPDRDGQFQDIVVGYDDPRRYLQDALTNHTYFCAVIGHIANRIRNGTFTLDGKEYRIPKNENGIDTFHGGDVGYDQRDWTVTSYSESSTTFTYIDYAQEGFPGDVLTHAMLSVDADQTEEDPNGLPQLTTELVFLSMTEKSHVMLSNHIYWNLNAFKEPTILNDTSLQLPLSKRLVGTDSINVPDGSIVNANDTRHQAADFTFEKLIAGGICGLGCVGYDNCFIVDRDSKSSDSSDPSILRMSSSTTGISMETWTNQQVVQVYTCISQNGTMPIKESQVKRNKGEGVDVVKQYGCIAIEPEGWVDGINHPEWGQLPNQFFSPEAEPAVDLAKYRFGTG